MSHKAAAAELTSSPATAPLSQTPYPSSVTLSGFVEDHSIRRSFPAKCHTAREKNNKHHGEHLNQNSQLDDIDVAKTQ